MKLQRSLCCFALLALCGTAFADNPKETEHNQSSLAAQLLPPPARPPTASAIYNDGQPIGLVDTYAFRTVDPTDLQRRKCTVVAFTDHPMDKAALNAAADPTDELRNQQQNSKFENVVILMLVANGRVIVRWAGADSYTGFGEASEALSVKRNDEKHIEGSFVTKDAREKRLKGHIFWDLHFALDVASAQPAAN